MTPLTDPVPEPVPEVKLKHVLKGMPFTRKDLATATKRAFRAAGRTIPWSEARARGYAQLFHIHFPRIK